jgi:hypothetical protein
MLLNLTYEHKIYNFVIRNVLNIDTINIANTISDDIKV